MTREDLAVTSKEEMQFYLAHGKEFGSMPATLFANMWELFSKVFDNFESRTCESCIFSESVFGEMHCRNQIVDTMIIVMDTESYLVVNKDFGCNKWESKDD